MNAKQFLHLSLAGCLALGATGCASIIDGGPRHISVKSEPSDAKVTVYNKKGEAVLTQQTPAVLALKRGNGYFSGASYHVVIEKDGYHKSEVDLKATVNGWYFGNFLFGGLIGLLIVDPATGAMYTLTPSDVSVVLSTQSASHRLDKNSIFVILRKDLPNEFASRLVPVPTE